MKRLFFGLLLFIAIERFCYFQTGTFSLSKMTYTASPPSPTSTDSPIQLQLPLRFLGAGKQFYAFETADEQYVVKFMKWSRRRPNPWLPERAKRAVHLQQSCHLALQHLPQETQLLIPQSTETFTLIDKLGIVHTLSSHSTHYYVQRKASPFTDYFTTHPIEAPALLQSFIHTVAAQCRRGIFNSDPIIDRNYGVVQGRVILLDIGSFSTPPTDTALIQREIVLELLPLRAYLQKHHPQHLATFDVVLNETLRSCY